MPLMGKLKEGSAVEIIFQADNANPGSTAVLTGYIPDDGSPQMIVVAPGGVQNIFIPALARARQLRIYINTPEPFGKGNLIVTQNNEVQHEDLITDDAVWAYVIIESAVL